ncbi:(S)-benzoin forming benzil reductase [Bacillus cereus group sp. BfR-BA-01380]|uniref:(S)-benzoin forming benzil reductase n=1 Tax=Bacillus cereus group sp. BfR-BA-01380 TaxID=2920324 RepID=UPI001F585A9C|nr:(S)-benzoin forming benzil reductase [Bacillus cereus group sp. BfR-BA-01380]
MRYVVLTGTSRGLGEAIAAQLLEKGTKLISISRKQNEQLIEKARQLNIPFDFYSFDLQDVHQIESFMGKIFSNIDVTTVSSIHLINNAGMLAPMKPLERSESEQLIANVHVNLLAPMLLSAAFMNHTKDWSVDKRIINISSGAGQKPYFGWGAYCTTKAGINMFTKCIAVEETDKKYPVKIISFAPGVIDTNMQAEIRQTSKEDFIHLERFLALKEDDQLLSPNYVARAVIDLLETNHFNQGDIIRIDEK